MLANSTNQFTRRSQSGSVQGGGAGAGLSGAFAFDPGRLSHLLLGNLYITLSMAPIVPGEDLRFSFHCETNVARALDLGTVTMSLFLVDADGNPLFHDNNTNKDLALWTATLTLGTAESLSPKPFTSQVLTVKSTVIPPPQLNSFYKVDGGYSLRLVLKGTGKDAGPYTSVDTPLSVVYETTDGSWWEWTVPKARTVEWKVGRYPIEGRIHNKGRFLIMSSWKMILIETDPNGNVNEYSSDSAPSTLAPGASPPITFGGPRFPLQNYSWFIPGIYLINGQLARTYWYSVQLNMQDQFGNVYDAAVFSAASATVRVSDGKIAAAISAYAAFGAWATCSAIAAVSGWNPIGWGAAAAATAALATLGIFAKITEDPPSPNPRYAVEVLLEMPALPARLRTDPHFTDLADAFELVLRIAATADALGTIESRVLGAQAAGDCEAEKRQRGQYAALAQSLVDHAGRIDEVARRALPALDPARMARGQPALPSAGVAPTHPTDTDASLPEETRKLADILRRMPLTFAQLGDPRRSFERLASAARNFALSFARRPMGV